MNSEQLETIFKSPYQTENWKAILRDLFKGKDVLYTQPIVENPQQEELAPQKDKIVKSRLEIGSHTLGDDKTIRFYEVELMPGKHVSRNRVQLRNLLHNRITPGDTDAILVCFYTPGDTDWRLTFISKSIYWDEEFTRQKEETHPKRYTYVLGQDESVRTALSQFGVLFENKVTIARIIEAFSVEKLNKEFFSTYEKFFKRFWNYINEDQTYRKLFIADDEKKREVAIRDFTKKLLGRIVFLYFLQKKGWMGCPANSQSWEGGEKQFMQKLFDGFNNLENFHSECLSKLFFNTLNEQRANDVFEVDGLENELNGTRVPYLNGGLFEADNPKGLRLIDFPEYLFKELLDFLNQYNFTIDENSPDDHEVGIDPEMLGHIFENLLEDNHEKGAYYTPKEIVQYMTQESLIQYLQTHLGEHPEIEQLIRYSDKGDPNDKRNYIRQKGPEIEQLLDRVRICDPAIGSGAFPMGMLQEIFKAKMTLDWTFDAGERAKIKRDIIQNSIYGVDLENGAVDIARLRFWLALVVDEEKPEPLPNLDYKIMQGNSLLESFEGIDLSEIDWSERIDQGAGNLLSGQLIGGTDKSIGELIHDYFGLTDPIKKDQAKKEIQKQIPQHIHRFFERRKGLLEKEANSISRKLNPGKNKKSPNKNEARRLKKSLKSISDKLTKILHSEVEIKEKLYEKTDRPFFLWHLFFKEVFDEGGFDVVIGNPPWGAHLEERESKMIKEINEDIIVRMTDSFMFFINDSLKRVRNLGTVSMIVPEVLLNQQDNRLLRKKLVEQTTITNIVNLGDGIFSEVTRASCIVIIKKRKK